MTKDRKKLSFTGANKSQRISNRENSVLSSAKEATGQLILTKQERTLDVRQSTMESRLVMFSKRLLIEQTLRT